ncbi:MAG: hypothetical protein K6E38_05590 [Fretibacterium sp.]|nr:hypothetical protein [Fretibacterium sp.]
MKKFFFVKVLLACLMVGLLIAAASAAQPAKGSKASKPSQAQQLRQMSTFLSNFTEVGLFDFDLGKGADGDTLHLGGNPSHPELIRFGIMHNYINNYKSRIKPCPTKGCKHGSLVIDAKFVAESVKKYFGIRLKHVSVKDPGQPFYFDGRLYHFEGADGEAVYYAEVKQAERDGAIIRMTGDLYNSEDKDDRPYTFEAAAKPYKWNGKDTWVILSFKAQSSGSDSEPDMAGLLAPTKGTWRFDGAKDTAYIVMDGKGNFDAYYASGALEMSGTLEPSEEYEGVYIYLLRDKSGKDLDMGFFMDSETQLHFGNDEGQIYIKDKD